MRPLFFPLLTYALAWIGQFSGGANSSDKAVVESRRTAGRVGFDVKSFENKQNIKLNPLLSVFPDFTAKEAGIKASFHCQVRMGVVLHFKLDFQKTKHSFDGKTITFKQCLGS